MRLDFGKSYFFIGILELLFQVALSQRLANTCQEVLSTHVNAGTAIGPLALDGVVDHPGLAGNVALVKHKYIVGAEVETVSLLVGRARRKRGHHAKNHQNFIHHISLFWRKVNSF